MGGARACPNLASVMCVQDACDDTPSATHLSMFSQYRVRSPVTHIAISVSRIAQCHAIKPPFSRVATSLARFVRSRTRDLSGGGRGLRPMHFYRIKLVKGLFKLQQPGLNAETGEGVAYSGASCHATLM